MSTRNTIMLLPKEKKKKKLKTDSGVPYFAAKPQ